MTTGNRVVDARTYQNTTWSGSVLAGAYATKVWSGTDWPDARPIVRPNTWTSPHYHTEFYFDASRGSMRRRKVLSPPVEVQHRTVWIKQPHRYYEEEHPYNCTFFRRFDPVMHWGNKVPYTDYTSVMSSMGFGPTGPADPWTAAHDLKLLNKLRNRVAGNGFHAGLAAVEMDKTLRMIAETVHRLARGIHHASRGNFYAAARVLSGNRNRAWHKTKPAAKNWLELQYGWLPLYSDVYDGAQFLAHHFNVPLQDKTRVTVVARGARPVSASPTICEFTKWENFTRKTIIAKITEKDVLTLSGLLDPAGMIWERIPFSFVFDWFLPIGDWLQARQLPQGLKGQFVTSTLRKWRVAAPKGLGNYHIEAPYYYYEMGSFTREISTTLTVPFPDVKPARKIASLVHAANAIALLSTLDRKLFSKVYS